MGAFPKINRPRGQQDARTSGNADHVRDADARTARNTAVNWVASSMPDTMRTTAPASLTSIAGAADAARATGAGRGASVVIGTKSGAAAPVVLIATVVVFWHAARRQPNTCCEQTCQRRATSDTRAPGTRLSSTIRAFSSADQRRRRPGPTSTSTRRYSPFASSLTSNITIARCPLPRATQPPSGRPLKKGVRAPLTAVPGFRSMKPTPRRNTSPTMETSSPLIRLVSQLPATASVAKGAPVAFLPRSVAAPPVRFPRGPTPWPTQILGTAATMIAHTVRGMKWFRNGYLPNTAKRRDPHISPLWALLSRSP
jgi:hypothetical protein